MRVRAALLAICLVAACSSAAPGSIRPQVTAPAGGTVAGLEWRSLAPVPTPRTEVAAAAVDGNIYVIGGFDETGTVATVEVYDIATDSWTTGPPLPIAVNHAMAATAGGEIYVIGGYLGPGLNNPTKRAFVLEDDAWRELPAMFAPRAAGGAAGARNRIWVAGGIDSEGLAGRTFSFKPSTERWRSRNAIPTRREHLGVAATAGSVYVMGGRTSGMTTNLDTTQRFDIERTRWKSVPPLRTARGGLGGAATPNGFIIAVGGEGPDGTFEEVEAFDVDRGRWRRLPDLPTPRHGLGVVAVGTVLYVLAGGPEPGLTFSDANEAIDLAGLGK